MWNLIPFAFASIIHSFKHVDKEMRKRNSVKGICYFQYIRQNMSMF